MILLFKASVILFVLLAFYKLVLERESFFGSNRIYLLACLVFAIALPFIPLPQLVKNQGYVSNIIDRQLEVKSIAEHTIPNQDIAATKSAVSSESKEFVEIANGDPYEHNSSHASNEAEAVDRVQSPTKNKINSLNWILLLYLFGVVVLTINLIAQVISVFLKANRAEDKIEDEGYVLVNLQGEIEPCSFFKYIFINPSLYDYDTYEQILNHEKIHVDKKHTIDLIISELAVIVFWFNPFVWLLRQEIEKNIEYQTDWLILESDKEIKESYQLNLVEIASNKRALAVTTNYNQSLIKQRILKMNGKRSHRFSYWKYAFLLPLLFTLLLGLNKPSPLNAVEVPQADPQLSLLDDNINEEDIVNPNLEDTLNDGSSNDLRTTTVPIDSSIKVKEEFPKEVSKGNVQKVEAIEKPKLAELSSLDLSTVAEADCKEFEDAVARGDLERVKEILKDLHPDCLKLAKGILETKKEEETNTSSINEELAADKTACNKLEVAVENRDKKKVRSILLNDDVSCLKDIYGDPTQDDSLVKGLLRYGARLSIDEDGIIHIKDVNFEISTYKDGGECDDPDYLELSEAIMMADRSRIRKLLATRDFECPLNTDGVTNDFPFLKEMMKYRPELLVVNRESVMVYGVGVDIDIFAFDDKKNSKPSGSYQDAISELDRIMSQGYRDVLEPGCLDLLNAVDVGNEAKVSEYLKNMDTDCYHKVTETSSGPLGTTSVNLTITPLILASAHADLGIMKIIVDNGADVNYQGDGSQTALMYAVESRKLEAVKYLIEKGAKINVEDERGYSALDYAVAYQQRDIIRYLKLKGAKEKGLKRL